MNYVYGEDDRQLDFVRKHFATKKQPRLMASIADKYEADRIPKKIAYRAEESRVAVLNPS